MQKLTLPIVVGKKYVRRDGEVITAQQDDSFSDIAKVGDEHIYAATRFVLHEEKKTPHKHAELIKAWADGAEIQFKSQGSTDWRDASTPQWNLDCQYRIKPEPKPDRHEYVVVQKGSGIWRRSTLVDAQAKAMLDSVILHLIYDGETDKIKTSTIVQ